MFDEATRKFHAAERERKAKESERRAEWKRIYEYDKPRDRTGRDTYEMREFGPAHVYRNSVFDKSILREMSRTARRRYG